MAFPKIKKAQEWSRELLTNQWHVKHASAATKTGETNRTHLITEIIYSIITDATIQVKSGSTVLWEWDAKAADVCQIEMSGCPVRCNLGEAATVTFSAGTGKINISGITI